MKKLMWILLMFLVMPLTGCSSNNSYLRIHIRANSNLQIDQDIKYLVKDVLVEYLTPYMQECDKKQDVVDTLNSLNDEMESIVDNLLVSEGFEYKCKIEINNEFFPTRTYGELTLEADYYDALIVNLGSGTGDNWWCVMYPNLCFNEPTNVVYKSKIVEIIKKLKG